MTVSGGQVSFFGSENVMELHNAGDCMTLLNAPNATELYILK